MVQTQHGGEVLARQAGSRLHRDVGVGVGGITDHQNLDIARRNGIQGFALLDEYLCVVHQQVFAFHAWTTRLGADQQRVVSVLEGDVRVTGTDEAGQQGKGAVVEFHHYALQRSLGLFGGMFEQLQDHGLILAQHVAGSNAEDCGVTDLPGSAGHCNSNGGFCHL